MWLQDKQVIFKARYAIKYGDLLGMGLFKDVTITKKAYNMFSCTKMQCYGWILGCDKEAIWLQKGDKKF